jgi:excinuclease UvrABC nuclease subunit
LNEIERLLPEKLDMPASGEGEFPGADLPGGGGVYAFLGRNGELIQFASGQSLRRIISHRLTPPADRAESTRRADLAAVTAQIRWQRTDSVFETTWAYYRVARILFPATYRKLIAFGPSWFVHVESMARLPRFVVSNKVYDRPGRYLGPFPTRRDAAEFVSDLEDSFDLCRYHDILDKTPNGQACAYFEMGKCPAPCDGTVPIEDYNRSVEQAGHYAWGRRDPQVRRWQHEMAGASRALAFERAAVLKTRIDRAMRPARPSHAWVRDADEFQYLIVQRAGGTSWVKPFYAAQGRIETGPGVRLRDLPKHLESWVRGLDDCCARAPDSVDCEMRAEQAWLVSHFLFKGAGTPGAFLHRGELGDVSAVLERIRATFARRTKTTDGAPSARNGVSQSNSPTQAP